MLPISATLAEGEAQALEATVKPAGEAVTWASSDEDVATVDASGLVTAVAAGTATIDVYAPGEFTVHFCRLADWSATLNIYY